MSKYSTTKNPEGGWDVRKIKDGDVLSLGGIEIEVKNGVPDNIMWRTAISNYHQIIEDIKEK